MDVEKELKKIGLKKPEIAVYLYLLENGLSSPTSIAKGTKILRANTYNVIQSLEERGLVEKQLKGKRNLHFAKDPSSLILNLEEKKEAVTRMLPDLRALYKAEKNKPTVKFYYGMEEVKEVFSRIDGAKELLYVVSTNELFEEYPDFFKKFRKQVASKGIMVRDILTQEAGVSVSKKTKEVMKGYYDFRLFEQKYEDLPTTIRIWGDNIALVTFEDSAFCTLVTNKSLAKTFKVMFETMWESGRVVE